MKRYGIKIKFKMSEILLGIEFCLFSDTCNCFLTEVIEVSLVRSAPSSTESFLGIRIHKM